jgi:MoxR-like ATPase
MVPVILARILLIIGPLFLFTDQTMSKTKLPVLWHEQLPVILTAGITRVLLHGPPDTGKTTTAGKLAEKRGQQVFRLQCSRDQGIEDLLGQFTLSDGSTKFAPGPIPQAMACGGMLICDEFDFRNPAHDSIYHSVLDEREIAEVRLPDGTTVKPADGFTVVCTTNAAPNVFSAALLRRWELKLYCAIAHPEALASLPPKQAKFLNNLQSGQKVPEFRFELSVSAFKAVARLSAVVPEDHALTMVFGEQAAREIESSLASI